jgi:GNAT superfamily N-acetyltransferase
MIRKATADDLPRILDLGAEFLALGPYAWVPLDLAAFETFCRGLLEVGVIFLSDDGLIAGCLSPFYFNPSVVMAAELFWFARSDGRALRQALEDWAKDQGCVALTCSGLANEREATIRRLYGRAGYDVTEVAFVKRFQP